MWRAWLTLAVAATGALPPVAVRPAQVCEVTDPRLTEPDGRRVVLRTYADAYEFDGRALLTVSERATAARPAILRYPLTVPSPAPSPKASPRATSPARRPSTVVGAVGVVAAFAVAVAVLLVVLRRRR